MASSLCGESVESVESGEEVRSGDGTHCTDVHLPPLPHTHTHTNTYQPSVVIWLFSLKRKLGFAAHALSFGIYMSVVYPF